MEEYDDPSAMFAAAADILERYPDDADFSAPIWDDMVFSLGDADWAWLAVVQSGINICPLHLIRHATIAEAVQTANAVSPALGS